MKRIFAAIIIVAAVVFAAVNTVHAAVPSRPNVVLIQLDDLDTASVQMALDKGLMPNLKKYFVDAGYNFNNSYTTGSFGTPSRASMLTGQYPHNHGEIGSHSLFGGTAKLDESSTVATWLNASGYLTLYVGRYLAGWGSCEPRKFGFCNPPYIPQGWNYWVAPIDHTTWSVTNYKLYVNGATIDFTPYNNATGGLFHQVDVLGLLMAPPVISKAPLYNKPFFFVFAPVAYNREMVTVPPYNVCPDPKDPYFGGNYWGVSERPANRHLNTIYGKPGFDLPKPPSFNEADVSDKPDYINKYRPLMNATDIDCAQKRWWRRLELLRTVDDSIGSIMTTLENTSQINNTIVIVTADNGMVDGQHRFPEKTLPYEESLRVLTYVRMPGNTAPKTIENPVSNVDLAETVSEIAGVTPLLETDGRSMMPLIRGENVTWRKVILIQHNNSAMGPAGAPDFFAARTFGDKPRKYVKYSNPASGIDCELYDLSTDPYEMQNVCYDPARQGEVAALQQYIDAMKVCHGDSCRSLEENFVLP